MNCSKGPTDPSQTDQEELLHPRPPPGFFMTVLWGQYLDLARSICCTGAVAVGPATVVLGVTLAHPQRDLLLHCINRECHGDGETDSALDPALIPGYQQLFSTK